MTQTFFRKARQVADDPVLRKWLLRRLLGGVSSPPAFTAHRPPYLHGVAAPSNKTGTVVDPFNQCWDASHLFVTDGACWPTCGWQNPALTEMAVTARACDHAVDELKKMNL